MTTLKVSLAEGLPADWFAAPRDGDVGYDIRAAEDVDMFPGDRLAISTGVFVAIPPGYYGRVAPRSSLGVKGVDVAAGVIDPSYRGEIKVVLVNTSRSNHYDIYKGDKIAQLILEACTVVPVELTTLDTTTRGEGGFGSTGSQ